MALIEHRREANCPTCVRPSMYLQIRHIWINSLIPLELHELIVPSAPSPFASLSTLRFHYQPYIILDYSSVPPHNNCTSLHLEHQQHPPLPSVISQT